MKTPIFYSLFVENLTQPGTAEARSLGTDPYGAAASRRLRGPTRTNYVRHNLPSASGS